MPSLFGNSSPFDQDVEKVTNEKNTSEDWALILDICDKVGQSPSGPKDVLKAIIKKIHSPVPHTALQALTLLDACVKNCGKKFHLEVASREFEGDLFKLVLAQKTHQKVKDKTRELLKKWAENEFKSDPQLELIPAFYQRLKSDGVKFPAQEPTNKKVTESTDSVVTAQKEEEDFLKAVQLSLKDGQSTPKASSLYPQTSSMSSSTTPSTNSSNPTKEPKKVRAVYDFEAAEDNELTFKAGEIIHIIDDSDPNWWKGSNQRGEGLFPANFVTSELNVQPEETHSSKPEVSEIPIEEEEEDTSAPEIDEEKIDKVLYLLNDADPEGEQPDSPELHRIEEQTYAMGPLIDQELEKIDKKHAALSRLSQDLLEGLNMYHVLMREMPPPVPYPYSGAYSLQGGPPHKANMYQEYPPNSIVPPHQMEGHPQPPMGLPPGMPHPVSMPFVPHSVPQGQSQVANHSMSQPMGPVHHGPVSMQGPLPTFTQHPPMNYNTVTPHPMANYGGPFPPMNHYVPSDAMPMPMPNYMMTHHAATAPPPTPPQQLF